VEEKRKRKKNRNNSIEFFETILERSPTGSFLVIASSKENGEA
jgi:hypothetical protein